MSPPKYKLIYFNMKALGEPIRQILHFLNVPFEDERVPPEKWPELKKSFKWHQIPEFHITTGNEGTRVLTQTVGICRYLARTHDNGGLMPSDAMDQTRCDQIADIVQEMRLRWRPYLMAKHFDGPDGLAKLPVLFKTIMEEQDFRLFLDNLEELLQTTKKGRKGDFILGDKVAWADFFLANFVSLWEESFQDVEKILDNRPNLKKQITAVENLPKIKEWIEKRKKTIC